MNAWTVVLMAGFGSFLFRMSMISLADRIRLPAQLDDSAALVAPTAFAALAVTSIASAVLSEGLPQASAPLAAAVVAVLAVLRTGSSHAAVLTGMPTLWLLTAFTSA